MYGAVDTYGGEYWCTSDMVGKPERKRRLERNRCRWEDNIEEIGWML
jgi:hypothetical protein